MYLSIYLSIHICVCLYKHLYILYDVHTRGRMKRPAPPLLDAPSSHLVWKQRTFRAPHLLRTFLGDRTASLQRSTLSLQHTFLGALFLQLTFTTPPFQLHTFLGANFPFRTPLLAAAYPHCGKCLVEGFLVVQGSILPSHTTEFEDFVRPNFGTLRDQICTK